MSMAAKLAQGSKYYIAGSASSAVTLTAITVGPVTTLAITGHTGLANGDVVTFNSGFAGTDAALLNGQTAVVQNYTTGTTNDSFTVAINTLAKTITIGTATATPAAWTQVKDVKSIKPAGAQATKIAVTDLDSTAAEYNSGITDNGTITLDIHDLVADPGQLALLASFTNKTILSHKVVLTGGSTRTFSATVLKYPTIPDAAIDGVQTGSCEIQISGAVTRS